MSMQQIPNWLGFWLVNFLVFYLTSLVVPEAIVLGNASISALPAALISGFLLMLVVILTQPVVRSLGVNIKKEEHWVIVYWISNSAAIWLIARGAVYTGLGIAGFWWAIILGLEANLFQWAVWKTFAVSNKRR